MICCLTGHFFLIQDEILSHLIEMQQVGQTLRQTFNELPHWKEIHPGPENVWSSFRLVEFDQEFSLNFRF